MARFLVVYYGGKMASTPKEIEKSNIDWMNWFKSMGKSLIDMGAPTMPGKMVDMKGKLTDTHGESITGYSVIMADNMEAAAKMAKTAPGMDKGMMVHVYPMMDAMMPTKDMPMPAMAAKK